MLAWLLMASGSVDGSTTPAQLTMLVHQLDYNSSVSSLPRCRGLFGGLTFLEFDLRSKVVIGTMCKYANFNV